MGPRARPHVRVNGFQYPRSGDQTTVMICYPLVTVGFITFIVWVEHSDISTLLALLLPHLFMVIVLLCNWFLVESLDPADKTSPKGEQLYPGIKVVCFEESTIVTRYCGSCRKQVYGLDHHCTWLNTCIGARNYVYFFSLVVTGFLQMSYQTVVGILFMTILREETVTVPESFLTFILTIAFGVLMAFHLYLLLWIRAGTYDWMMRDRDRPASSETRAARRKKELETAYRQQQVGQGAGTEVKIGVISSTGDIEFANTNGEQRDESEHGSDNNEQYGSASGDDVSEDDSFVSSETVVLNDPEMTLKQEEELTLSTPPDERADNHDDHFEHGLNVPAASTIDQAPVASSSNVDVVQCGLDSEHDLLEEPI